MGKTSAAPLKQTTLSWLELTAATVAVPANRILLSEIDILLNHVAYCSDSTATLRYFQNSTARFHIFLANRWVVIHEVSHTSKWKYMYINTKLNPADHASPGLSADSWVIWRNGVNAAPFRPPMESKRLFFHFKTLYKKRAHQFLILPIFKSKVNK